jgi:hypothetical protein
MKPAQQRRLPGKGNGAQESSQIIQNRTTRADYIQAFEELCQLGRKALELVIRHFSGPQGSQFVPANETHVARPQLRRWEQSGKVRVVKAGREKLYSLADIAALAERATPRLTPAETGDACDAMLAAITAKAGGN